MPLLHPGGVYSRVTVLVCYVFYLCFPITIFNVIIDFRKLFIRDNIGSTLYYILDMKLGRVISITRKS